MAYLLQVWEQPSDLPLPESEAEIWRMLEQLRERSPGVNPKYTQLADELMTIYPEVDDPDDESDVWLEGRADGNGTALIWNLALSTAGPLDEAQAVIASRAVRAGLNLADQQAADLYLADGRIYSRRAEAQLVHAFAAYYTGNKRGAWEQWVPLGASGNATALKQMASMALIGEAVPKNPSLGYAMLVLAGDASEAKHLARYLGPDVLARSAELVQQLRVQSEFADIISSLTERRASVPKEPEVALPAEVLASPPAAPEPLPQPLPEAVSPTAQAREVPAPWRASAPSPARTTFLTMTGGDWIALGFGLFGMLIVLPLALAGATKWAIVLTAVVALASAWGTWRGARVLGFETGKALSWTAIALVPLVGIGVCVLFVLALSRSRH
jgi:hypothetical protein